MSTDTSTPTDELSHAACKARINAALKAALTDIGRISRRPFTAQVNIDVPEDPSFWAEIRPTSDGVLLSIPQGVVLDLHALWTNGPTLEYLLLDEHGPLVENADTLVHTSLTWLILHELAHYELSHFRFAGQDVIGETGETARFHLARRADARPVPALALPKADQAHIAPCLEMQADHSAMDYVLGGDSGRTQAPSWAS